MRKKKYGIVIAFALVSGLTACTSNTFDIENSVKTETIGEKAEKESTETSDSDQEARKTAYRSVLEGIYYDHVFPDGTEWRVDEFSDMSENKFAVCDIDSDGKDELIIVHITTSTAGMIQIIYDFDSEMREITKQFSEYPALTFYNNGVIEAKMSHNQGLAGEFWPYTLYQYDWEADSYDQVGIVDAWDKSLSEKDFSGNPFPEETDVDGDGIVYYIMTGGEYELNTPVDFQEYDLWRDSYVGGAQEINIPFMDMIEENIQSLK